MAAFIASDRASATTGTAVRLGDRLTNGMAQHVRSKREWPRDGRVALVDSGSSEGPTRPQQRSISPDVELARRASDGIEVSLTLGQVHEPRHGESLRRLFSTQASNRKSTAAAPPTPIATSSPTRPPSRLETRTSRETAGNLNRTGR